MKIAYFGGTFAPPHLGHAAVIRAALADGRVERVLVAPAYRQPFKTGNPVSLFADRLEMVRLAFGDIPGVELCDLENRLKLTPSYTSEVLRALHAERPDDELYLLLGGDSLAMLHLWHEPETILRYAKILTFPRRGETPDEAFLQQHWSAERARELAGSVIAAPFFEISSTELRKKIAFCENTTNSMAETVEDYARRRKLYEKRMNAPVSGEREE